MKKAEISTSFLTGLIILVVSFVVIMGFWYLVFSSYQGRLDKDSCRVSILSRGTFNYKEIGMGMVPLKCKTERICITSKGGGRCLNQFGVPNKNNPITFIELSGNNDTAKYQIVETFANSMYDCHWMLGEGKVVFLPSDLPKQRYCIICSNIAFDDNEERGKEIFLENITFMDLLVFLDFHENLDGESFFEFIYGEKNIEKLNDFIDLYKDELIKNENEINPEQVSRLSFYNSPISPTTNNAIVVQIIRASDWKRAAAFWGTAGGVATAGGIILAFASGVGIPVGVGALISLAGGSYALGYGVAITMAESGETYISPMIVPYESLRDLDCTSFENIP